MLNEETPDPTEVSLPHEVVEKLRAVSSAKFSVPKSVDEAILQDARHVLADGKPSRRRFTKRTWTVGFISVGSLAAALMIAVLPQWNAQEAPRMADASSVAEQFAEDDVAAKSVSSGLAFQREDVDRNGRVDILDAFALARNVRDSGASDLGDQNGDGIVDDSDITLVARSAVML